MMSTAIERLAVERANLLFHKRRLVDIQAIEKASLDQIEDKKTKLRELVGESYGDVIQTTDAVLDMAAESENLMRDLKSIRSTFGKSNENIESKEEALDDGMMIVGSRVKYIMDAQEVVWSALDAGEYLEAARRIVKSEMVFEGLMNHAEGDVRERFPFVEHLRPGMVQLKHHAVDQVKQELSGTHESTIDAVVTSLSAIITLDRMPSTEALKLYLRQRKLRLVALATHNPASTPQASLISLSRAVQETAVHVSRLFLQSMTEPAELPLQKTLKSDPLGFGGRLIGRLGDWNEESVWKESCATLFIDFGSVPSTHVHQMIQSWLQDVAQMVHEAGPGLLLNCRDLETLADIESDVKAAISDSSDQEIQDILGSETALWKVLFESMIQEKCLSLLTEAFSSASQGLISAVQETKTRLNDRPSTTILGSDRSWKPRNGVEDQTAPGIVNDFDHRLGDVLRQLIGLLNAREHHHHGGDHSPTSVRQGSVRSFSVLSGTQSRPILLRKSERSSELEPKIQSLWESTAYHLAGQLDGELPERDVEGAMFVGTVAMGLAEQCPNVGMLAGPSEEWRSETVPRSTRSSIKQDASTPQQMGDAFRRVAFKGVRLWLDWGIDRWVTEWKEAAGKLSGSETLQAVTIAHEEEGMSEDRMQFSIPSSPSEATVKLLVDVSMDLDRLGPNASHSQILHLLQFKLEAAVRKTIESWSFGETTSDDIVLQLLLDFRFLRDICSDGSPVPSFEDDARDVHRSLSAVPEDAISLHDSGHRQDPVIKREIQESRRRSDALESLLFDRLDPIDWATYEPHLWSAERRSYRRMSVLFGIVGYSHRLLHATEPIKLPSGSNANCFHVMPVTQRFQYLPVRSTMGDGSQRSASGVTYASLVEDEDPSGNYSFSDLVRANVQATGTRQADVGAFSSLGSMFTDKAAEMSALAQQRFEQFGDYLQPSGLTSSSLFSSFAKRSTASPTEQS